MMSHSVDAIGWSVVKIPLLQQSTSLILVIGKTGLMYHGSQKFEGKFLLSPNRGKLRLNLKAILFDKCFEPSIYAKA